ncbi:ABC-type polysaccharide/polyol phosphate transport system, ATPase component [Aequorivita sublithincola DSM 14238]|uniref:ABC-type polysaccharide/polyol phosphate transport system, ATPase component n=1 Tax=Aequorivita sublithincola (strain DSM 14238 / LMG 21431 / ACAM 643 / 9-3) TaxID=746697 RepID=I3YXH1_AEQSU|nr:ABC transporter ATP-binding protein [Aequorivita sublithincola]AFL81689.1 ABC-type polysaccharide/polyol phosphate transport system, ATPase component [Aequorivita sublithincola DSM 14238]
MGIILKAENISKQYRLGTVGTGTIKHDFNRFWHRIRGKENPYLKIGGINDRSSKATEEYVWALRDINFEVQEGEVLGIIGKNGAGKSTLLKILSRVTSPTTGVIKTRGRIASLLEVGTGFHSELTGRENIYLNGAILGMTKTEIASKIDEIIEFSGCELYIDTPVKRYSSGMTVRLAFAVAAHLEPDILVVDEVLAVGDAEFQKKAIGKMKDISREGGRTVLFVSHNMAAVKSLCTRAIVLEHGKTIFEGDTNEAVDFYLNTNLNTVNKKLLDRNDRKGAGNFIIEEIKKINSSGKTSEIFLSGDSLTFHIKIGNRLKIPIKDLRMDFGLNDSNDLRVSWFSTSLFEKQYNFEDSERIKIIMEIPNIPLYAGFYTLTSNLIVNGNNEDWLPHAVSFEIENGDFYRTGKMMISQQGNFLINHKFK